MRPDNNEGDFLVIDASLDPAIFPSGISNGLDVLAPGMFSHHHFDDGYADFPEIDIDEFRDHI